MSKLALIAAAAVLMTAGAAAAQTTTSTTTTTTTVSTALSLDTPIEQVAAVPAGKAVLDKDIPGLLTHPAYDQFKGMSLKEVQPMSQGAITDDMLAKTGADLAAVSK
jgi:hypothetical protein